jgi:hypothetical protein
MLPHNLAHGEVTRMPSEEATEFDVQERRERELSHNVKLGYGALAAWPAAFIASLMSGDAPGHEQQALHIVTGVFLAAFAPVATHVAARIVFSFGRYKTANWIALLPLVVVATLVGGMILSSVVVQAWMASAG